MHDSSTSNNAGAMPGRRKPVRGWKVLLGVLGVMMMMTLGAVVAPSLAVREQPPELEIYGDMPDFTLTDQTGATMTRADLLGQVAVVNFIFTRCLSICPVSTMKMYRVQERTKDVAQGIKLVSFSVDPAHDTPEVLAAYAAKHKADIHRWRFLTGTPEDVRKVVTDGLATAMEQAGLQPDGTPNIVHSPHFVLIDHMGRIRGYYDSNDAPRLERMLRDARRLLKQSQQPPE